MAVSTIARSVQSASTSTVSRRSHVHAPASRTVTSYVRASRPRTVNTSAAYRSGGGSTDPMVDLINDVAKAWKAAQTGYSQNQRNSGSTYGSGFKPSSPNRKPSLPYDVIRTEASYQLLIDIPGLAKPDLKIRVSNPKSDQVQGSNFRVLTVSGERQAPLQEGYVQKQRKFGGFENVWELPADADSDGISAKVTDGVLTVTVTRKQPQPEKDDSQEIFIS